jgi:hypothetical protein
MRHAHELITTVYPSQPDRTARSLLAMPGLHTGCTMTAAPYLRQNHDGARPAIALN